MTPEKRARVRALTPEQRIGDEGMWCIYDDGRGLIALASHGLAVKVAFASPEVTLRQLKQFLYSYSNRSVDR